MNTPYPYMADYYQYQNENGYLFDQQVQQSPISFNDQTPSLDDINVDDFICLSNNPLGMGYLAVDLPNDVYSDESVYTTPSFQGDIINSSLDNSPISRCFSEPCTPNSDQEWKGDVFKGCRDEIEGTSVSNSVVKRLKKPVKKPKKKPENMKDCLHVWEFLRDLLKSEEFNGKFIKWLNKEKGLFKILAPNEVSNLWGKKKSNKEKMDYPNMARGIRYSREEGGYFDIVTKEDGFGKKLVYKFSKKASMHCEWLRSFMRTNDHQQF